jgi:hypothetical protein
LPTSPNCSQNGGSSNGKTAYLCQPLRFFDEVEEEIKEGIQDELKEIENYIKERKEK